MANRDDKLVRRQQGLSAPSKTSLTVSQQKLAVEINLTAQNSKAEPQPELVAEFSRVFQDETPEMLEWAFRAHRDRSPFFPAICEIRHLIRLKAAMKREEEREEEARRQRAERQVEFERAEAERSTPEFAAMVAEASARCAPAKVTVMRGMPTTEPVSHTPEEWEIRRARAKQQVEEAERARAKNSDSAQGA